MKKAGFTLFELALTISLMVILLLIIIPGYQHLQARNKTTSTVNHMIAAIHSARSSAIVLDQILVFCGSQDHQHCDGHWRDGQLIIAEQTQQILKFFSGLNHGDRLWWQSSLGTNNALKLAPSGFTNGQRGSFYYCPHNNPEQYGAKIIVSDSARIRIEYDKQELQQACAV